MQRRAVTLIELMAVVVLLSLAATLTVVRMDGFTDEARLRSTADQIDRLVQLARVRAVSSGMPQLIRFGDAPARLEVQEPQHTEGRWDWRQPPQTYTVGGANIEGVVTMDESTSNEWPAIRIDGRGRVDEHVILLRSHEQWAVIVSQQVHTRYARLPGPPEGRSFDELSELAP